jgi:polysaccharide deacetylase 2 family uncharacterized protein YibQ
MVKRKNKQSLNILTYMALLLSFVALAISVVIAGYFIGYDETEENVIVKKYKTKQIKQKVLKKNDKKSVNVRLKEILSKDNISNKTAVIQNIKSNVNNTKEVIEQVQVIKKEVIQKIKINKKEEVIQQVQVNQTDIGAAHEYESLPKAPKREFARITTRPRLAIIIDDVGSKRQVRAIKRLKLALTMSFLPPSPHRPNSPTLAAKERFYMVHLPMEAISYTKEEPFTLRTNDNQDKIFTRISKIKKLFPRVHYINNHTGSKFTADERSVNRLINVLNKLNISFIDSRTTAKTKVPKVMKNYGLKYVARDVFLDHHMDKAYVKKQIKLAIKTAKRHGTAIAIGHPHKNTLLALAESKKLLKEVDLVLINGLYK